jgi:hypothetical protein
MAPLGMQAARCIETNPRDSGIVSGEFAPMDERGARETVP